MAHLNIPPLFSNPAWQRCFEQYLESLQSHQTQTTYCSILTRFFRQFPNPDKVGSGDIEAFLSGSTRKSKNGTIADATINTRISCIRNFYQFASTYIVSGKKRLFKAANPADGIHHQGQPAQAQKKLEALHTIPLPASNGNGSKSPEVHPTHMGSEAPGLDSIKQSLQAQPGNTSLVALLQALMPTLPTEARETVRQVLAGQAAQRVNRGVHIFSPDEGFDGIDPTNQSQASEIDQHPGVLYPYGINASSFGGLSSDKARFVVVSQDLVTARRREVLATILHDLLGDVPALELAEDLAGNPLVIESGLFVFASNKVMPKPLSAINLRRMVDYFEQMGNNPEIWTCPYWKLADERSRQVAHWLPRDESQP